MVRWFRGGREWSGQHGPSLGSRNSRRLSRLLSPEGGKRAQATEAVKKQTISCKDAKAERRDASSRGIIGARLAAIFSKYSKAPLKLSGCTV